MKIQDLTNESNGEYVLYVNDKELMRSHERAELDRLKKQFPNYRIDIKHRQKQKNTIRYVLYIDGEPQSYSKDKSELYDVMMHVKQENPSAKVEIKQEPIS